MRAPRLRRLLRVRFRSLLLLLVLSAVLPFVLLTSIVLARFFAEARQSSAERLLQAARSQSALVEREFGATVRTLRALAESERLDGDSIADFDAEARRAVRTQPTWLAIVLMDAAGRQWVNTGYPPGAVLPEVVDAESLTRVVRTRDPVVGNLRRGARGDLAFAIRVPVMRDGSLRGVLTAVLSPQALGSLVAARLPTAQEWTRTVMDGNGTVVARTRSPERFVGMPATRQFLEAARAAPEGVHGHVTLEGKDVYVAHSRGTTYGWTSAVVAPTAVLDGPFRRSMWALTLITWVALAVAGASAFVLARRLSRDLGSAAGAAEALARGERPSIGPALVHEVTRLGEALEHSAALLARRQRERDDHLARAEAARRDAEAASRAKDEFLAMLGHELRNPLSPIVTALQLLKHRGGPWGREHAVIERQVQHVTRLVDDLLDTSRITRGKIELAREVVELHTVAARAVEITQPLFETMRHRLDVEVPATGCAVLGDPVRLAQVVANLLSNAARYTPPGGHVRVACRRADGEVELEVRDNGQGIDPDLLPRIFELFVQGPRTSDRREGGLGLGLALVQSLVHLHGGRVQASSDGPGHGSAFRIWLPAATEQAAADRGDGRLPAPSVDVPRRVLVVDDNRDAADMLASWLTEHGHDVMVAHDGPAALELADAIPPDLAIVDIGLPVMDGYELAHRLREQLGDRAPVFVAVTGYGQSHDRVRSECVGFAAHLVKPVGAMELQVTMNRILADRPTTPAG